MKTQYNYGCVVVQEASPDKFIVQIKSHLFVSVASIARFHSAIDKISAM